MTIYCKKKQPRNITGTHLDIIFDYIDYIIDYKFLRLTFSCQPSRSTSQFATQN